MVAMVTNGGDSADRKSFNTENTDFYDFDRLFFMNSVISGFIFENATLANPAPDVIVARFSQFGAGLQ
jgi:hypothetical protein